MAPVESKPIDLFDKVWHFDLAQKVISIGWKQLGDVTAMTRDELSEAVARTYSNKPCQTVAVHGVQRKEFCEAGIFDWREAR